MSSTNFEDDGAEPQTPSAQVPLEPSAESDSGSEVAPDAQAADNSGVTLGMIPATQAKPEITILSLRYMDGLPQLVVHGQTSLPNRLDAVDASGTVVATYAVSPAVVSTKSGMLVASSNTDASGLTLNNEVPLDGSVTLSLKYL